MIVLALFIEHTGLIHESFDFVWPLSGQSTTINGAHLQSRSLESILNLGDPGFCRVTERLALLRKAGNDTRPFCLQLTEGNVQFIGFPRPTDEILVGLGAGSKGHPLVRELGIVGGQELSRSQFH